MSESLTPDTKYVAYKANPEPVVKAEGVVRRACNKTCRLYGRKAIAKACSAIAASGISVNMDMFKLTYRA